MWQNYWSHFLIFLEEFYYYQINKKKHSLSILQSFPKPSLQKFIGCQILFFAEGSIKISLWITIKNNYIVFPKKNLIELRSRKSSKVLQNYVQNALQIASEIVIWLFRKIFLRLYNKYLRKEFSKHIMPLNEKNMKISGNTSVSEISMSVKESVENI